MENFNDVKTNDGLPFLQYDNGSTDNRILIFFSERSLRLLASSSIWFGDGTFKAGKYIFLIKVTGQLFLKLNSLQLAPPGFQQLYTIHGFKDGQAFPFAYVLAKHKDTETYKEVISAIKDRANELGLQLAPTKIMKDFESASMKAFRNRAYRQKLAANVAQRVIAITSAEIRKECSNMWREKGLKRVRASAKDKAEARCRINKRIRHQEDEYQTIEYVESLNN